MQEPIGFSPTPPEWEPIKSFIPVPGASGMQQAVFDDGTGQQVQFYLRPVRNEKASVEAGQLIVEQKEFVKVQKLGDKLTIFDNNAEGYHRVRFPKAYIAFRDGAPQKRGLRLEEWDYQLTDTQIMTFKLLGIEYVHDICNISDAQQDTLGIDARHIVARAKIDTQEAHAKAQAAGLQEQLDSTRRSLEKLQNENAQIMAMLQDKSNAKEKEEEGLRRELLRAAKDDTEVEIVKRRGRPRRSDA